jgi:hypothetical protein
VIRGERPDKFTDLFVCMCHTDEGHVVATAWARHHKLHTSCLCCPERSDWLSDQYNITIHIHCHMWFDATSVIK